MARLVFLGTPAVAVLPLQALHTAGHEIVLVVSGPDRRRGRGGATSPSPVKATALDLGLPVTDDLSQVVGAGAELGVVVAYGKLIREPVLSALPLVNLHFSLLPRWRGAAPVERAILAGDEETGVCLMVIEAGLDTGPVYERVETPIGDEETATEFAARLSELGSEMLARRLDQLPQSLGSPVAQEGEPTYAAKIDPSERQLDWARSATELARVVRIGHAATSWRGRRLLVHRARVAAVPPDSPSVSAGEPGSGDPGTLVGADVATRDGWLELVEVQPEGKARRPFAAWVTGARPAPGERFGNPQ